MTDRPASPSPTRGVILVATGAAFVAEAREAIASLRRHMPAIPLCLYTDQTAELPGVDRRVLVAEPDFSFLDKVRALRDMPYEQNLFLDTDVFVAAPLDDLLQLLDRFDLAFAYAPRRFSRIRGEPDRLYPSPVPEAFPEPNTGVIAFRRGSETERVLQAWERLYGEQMAADLKPGTDQPALRQALYQGDARFLVLPQEFNFRTVFPETAGMRVRVLHGRSADAPALAAELNADPLAVRCFVPGKGVTERHQGAADKPPPAPSPSTIQGPPSDTGFAELILRGKEYPAVAPPGYHPGVILDVGAHIGGASLWLHRTYPGAIVHALEPAPETFSHLRRNTAGLDWIRCHPLGLSNHSGQERLYLGARWAAASSTFPHGNSSDRCVQVEIRAASQFLREQAVDRVDVLKIDTEGHELLILGDIVPWLPEVDIIHLEYHSEEDRRDIDRLLAPWFHLYRGVASKPHRGVLTFVNSAFIERHGLSVGPPIHVHDNSAAFS